MGMHSRRQESDINKNRGLAQYVPEMTVMEWQGYRSTTGAVIGQIYPARTPQQQGYPSTMRPDCRRKGPWESCRPPEMVNKWPLFNVIARFPQAQGHLSMMAGLSFHNASIVPQSQGYPSTMGQGYRSIFRSAFHNGRCKPFKNNGLALLKILLSKYFL